MEQVELAWAAGFFDGEGCTNSQTQSGRFYPRVTVGQVDREPLDRFQRAIGGFGNVTGPYDCRRKDGLNHQPQFRFDAFSGEAIGILGLLWPYLCRPKRDQAMRIAQEYARTWTPPATGKNAPRPACGTTNGYSWHYRHNEPICDECLLARNEYRRQWRAKRRGLSNITA